MSIPLKQIQEIDNEIIRYRAQHLVELMDRLKEIDRLISRVVRSHPDGPIITSIPGIGEITAAMFIIRYIDIQRFPSANHFKAMLGFGVIQKFSGVSIQVKQTAKAHIPIRAAMFRVVLNNANKKNKIAQTYRKYRERMPFRKAIMRTGAKIITWLYYMLKHRAKWEDKEGEMVI